MIVSRLRSAVKHIFKRIRLDVCWDVFASPFTISNNSLMICIFHIVDMNKILIVVLILKLSGLKVRRVEEVDISFNRDMVLGI